MVLVLQLLHTSPANLLVAGLVEEPVQTLRVASWVGSFPRTKQNRAKGIMSPMVLYLYIGITDIIYHGIQYVTV
jgi:hypothetical protein